MSYKYKQDFTNAVDLVVYLTPPAKPKDTANKTGSEDDTETASRSQDAYLVSSSSLRTASKVWNKILDPASGFQKLGVEDVAGLTGLRVLDLHDDDSEALNLLFSIIHFRVAEVPKELGYEKLVQLAIVCDKYDAADATMPWVDRWVEKIISCGDYKPWGGDKAGWLLIGYLFRDLESAPKILEEVSKALTKTMFARRYHLSDSDLKNLICSERLVCNVTIELIPDLIYKHIVDEQCRVREEIRKHITDFFETMGLDGNSDTGQLSCQNLSCSDLAIGSLMRSLKKNKILGLVQSNWVNMNYDAIEELKAAIKTLTISTLVFTGPGNHLETPTSTGAVGVYLRDSAHAPKEGLETLNQTYCPLLKELDDFKKRIQKSVDGINGYKLPDEDPS